MKEGTIYERELPDGRLVEVMSLTFGRARIVISPDKDSMTWTDGWRYDNPVLAVCQAVIWDAEKWNRETNEGEPEGWQRAMNSGKPNRYPEKQKEIRNGNAW